MFPLEKMSHSETPWVKTRDGLRPNEIIDNTEKNEEQELFQCSGTEIFIYNWILARQEENYKNGGKFISDNDLRKEITQLKKTE